MAKPHLLEMARAAVACVAALLFGAAPAAAGDGELPAVLLVGDSTTAPQTGWGDALCARLEPALACLNLGRGGRSTLSYRAEGLWDRTPARLRAGSPGVPRWALIQFGHNDQPGSPAGPSARWAGAVAASCA